MKKYILLAVLILTVPLFANLTHAQGMMGNYYSNPAPTSNTAGTTAADEASGKALWDQLQTKQTTCAQLTNDDFDKLGDYFMGTMMGSSHEYMDQIMTNQIGADNEKLMHITMGKRLSGCDVSASYPNNGYGYVPMMQMMGGWLSSYGYNMMSGYGFGLQGWIFMLASIIWLIVGILAIVWILRKIPRSR